jgi:4-amino-4-deoxy-L-arabinose transferase-like glycosyltransferase
VAEHTNPPPLSQDRRIALAGGFGVALAVFVGMTATAPLLAIAWDEAYTLARLDRVRAWIAAVRDPQGAAERWAPARLRPLEDTMPAPRPAQIDTRDKLFRADNLAWFWPFAREEPHGHPTFYALAALAGDALAPGASELLRARLGTLLAFSLAAGGAFAFAARRWGPWAGAASAAAWALHPHLFALGHYATYDGLLASLWLGATLAFARAVEERPESKQPRWGAVVWFGVITGCALGTKLTGWFLPVPLLAWSALHRSRRGLLAIIVGMAVALMVLYIITPPFWPDPIGGLRRFFASNLGRSRTIVIKTLFLGKTYETPSGSLPWYNTLVWLGIATPALFLVLELIGAGRALRRWRSEPLASLFLIGGVFLLALRALPHTPGHDGTRQIIAGFGMLAMLAGPGAASVLARSARWGRIIVALAMIEGAASIALLMPVPLSYYSPIVGGLPGATALGMEPTYYWDALTDDALRRLDSRTPAGRSIAFVANPITWYYQESGRLRSGVWPNGGPDVAWYVAQNRPGAMDPVLRRVARRIGGDRRYILFEKFGVPLVWMFPAAEIVAEGRHR